MLDTGTLQALTPYQQELHDAHKARRAKWNVAARAVEKKCELSTAIARRQHFTPVQKVRVILRAVAEEFGVGPVEIIGASRFPHFITARFVAIYLARQITKLSLPHIGRKFGGRDHTTILNADIQLRKRLAAEPELAARVESLKATLLRQFAEG